jgi:hypothetical protein
MWMMELAMNTMTADNRMGSHSAPSPIMEVSPGWMLDYAVEVYARP